MAIPLIAQDPIRTLPKNYWVEFENPWTRVIHVHYGPHEKVGVHDHPGTPTLYVYLSDSGPVRFEHAGHDTFDLTRRPLDAGQMRISPGRIETHRVENLGDQPTDFLRVELKSLPLGQKEFEKRIPAPDGAFLRQARPNQVEFDDRHLRVVRLGVQPHNQDLLRGVPGVRTLWLAIEVGGASINGKPAHPGQAWDSTTLDVATRDAPLELVRVDVK